MKRKQSKNYKLVTYKINKKFLSYFGDERYIPDNGV